MTQHDEIGFPPKPIQNQLCSLQSEHHQHDDHIRQLPQVSPRKDVRKCPHEVDGTDQQDDTAISRERS